MTYVRAAWCGVFVLTVWSLAFAGEGGVAPAPGAGGSAATTKPAAPDALPKGDAITRRILILSIDGARPDLVLRAKMPTVQGLLAQSTFTFWARTTPHSITLPSHVSMLTGVVPRKHKIEWNEDLRLVEPVYPRFPTLFEVAKRAGLTTAMAAGKSKFNVLGKPGTLDWAFVTTEEKTEDADIAAEAVRILREHQPEVMFVHLPSVDNAGHKYGWSSPQQMAALAGVDGAVAQLLVALDDQKLREQTAVLITADHGGSGLTHMADDPRARFIPWILTGPGIRKGVDLTIYPKTAVDTEDTFATASKLLGLPMSADLDGEPVIEALEKPIELLRSE